MQRIEAKKQTKKTQLQQKETRRKKVIEQNEVTVAFNGLFHL